MGSVEAATTAAKSAPVPLGWQRYCQQLWEHPQGQLRRKLPGGVGLRLRHGDLLAHLEGMDAVVCSANKGLVGPARPDYWMFASYAGNSTDEAVHARAGPELLAACKALPFHRGEEGIRCPVGDAVVTPGTRSLLPDGFVVHAVAPGWHAEETSGPLLRAAWRSALRATDGLGARRLVAPALGCGPNRAPLEVAASCGLEVLSEWPCSEDGFEVTVVLSSYECWMAWAGRLHGFSTARARDVNG